VFVEPQESTVVDGRGHRVSGRRLREESGKLSVT
jgi:hypothetical protein